MGVIKRVKKAYSYEIKSCDGVLKIYKDRINTLDRLITYTHNRGDFELKKKLIKDLKKFKSAYSVVKEVRKDITNIIELQKKIETERNKYKFPGLKTVEDDPEVYKAMMKKVGKDA